MLAEAGGDPLSEPRSPRRLLVEVGEVVRDLVGERIAPAEELLFLLGPLWFSAHAEKESKPDASDLPAPDVAQTPR